jgi:hypothetical protein
MATGRLGTADLTLAGINTTVYTVPSDFFAVVSVNVCNRSNNAQAVRIAASSGNSPLDSEWIEFDVEIGAKGVLERTGIIIGAGQRIVVYSSSTNVSVVVFGIETPTT